MLSLNEGDRPGRFLTNPASVLLKAEKSNMGSENDQASGNLLAMYM